MLPELENIKSYFPFVSGQQATATQQSFMQCIKTLKIWTYLQDVTTIYVSDFSPSYFTVNIQAGTDITAVKIFSDGTFQNNENINRQNSFVQYSNHVTDTASCNLALLPQVICCIPKGLHIKIGKNPVTATAQIYSEIQQIIDWQQPSIEFLQGYNFSPSIKNNTLIFAAGSGLGKGSLTAFQMRNLLQNGNAESDSYYGGIRSINGQTSQLQIDTSSGIFMQTTTALTQEGMIQTLRLKRREEL